MEEKIPGLNENTSLWNYIEPDEVQVEEATETFRFDSNNQLVSINTFVKLYRRLSEVLPAVDYSIALLDNKSDKSVLDIKVMAFLGTLLHISLRPDCGSVTIHNLHKAAFHVKELSLHVTKRSIFLGDTRGKILVELCSGQSELDSLENGLR